jgi:hypothetical protein
VKKLKTPLAANIAPIKIYVELSIIAPPIDRLTKLRIVAAKAIHRAAFPIRKAV